MKEEADLLEAQAAVNEAYARSMERTTEQTNGRFGHLNNPLTYAGHLEAAANKRLLATKLRNALARLAYATCCPYWPIAEKGRVDHDRPRSRSQVRSTTTRSKG